MNGLYNNKLNWPVNPFVFDYYYLDLESFNEFIKAPDYPEVVTEETKLPDYVPLECKKSDNIIINRYVYINLQDSRDYRLKGMAYQKKIATDGAEYYLPIANLNPAADKPVKIYWNKF